MYLLITMYVSNERCMWVTNYVCESRTMYVSHQLCMWVTNIVCETRTMYVSHELCDVSHELSMFVINCVNYRQRAFPLPESPRPSCSFGTYVRHKYICGSQIHMLVTNTYVGHIPRCITNTFVGHKYICASQIHVFITNCVHQSRNYSWTQYVVNQHLHTNESWQWVMSRMDVSCHA